MTILALVFWTNSLQIPFLVTFYKIFPLLLLCYFLPSLLTLFGVVDPATSSLPFVAKRYLLPASLVLLTVSIDLREVLKLGPKALAMFFTGTVGVILGGPVAIMIVGTFNPQLVGGSDSEAVWRGLSTVAGSWIGGGANQVAMKEVFEPSDELFSVMLAVDIFVAEVWMAFLLLGIGKADWIDRKFGADSSSVKTLQAKMEQYSKKIARIPTTVDNFIVLGMGFGVTAVCHFAADILAPWIETNYPELNKFSLNSQFFWLIVLATTGGVILSFTRARDLEGVGASKLGTICIFILVTTIGLQMDILAVFEHPGLVSGRRRLDVVPRDLVGDRGQDHSSALFLSGRRQQSQHRRRRQRTSGRGGIPSVTRAGRRAAGSRRLRAGYLRRLSVRADDASGRDLLTQRHFASVGFAKVNEHESPSLGATVGRWARKHLLGEDARP